MPYKDLERKKEWERLHRPQRLARRRELRIEAAQQEHGAKLQRLRSDLLRYWFL
jgi:hypothetical protein